MRRLVAFAVALLLLALPAACTGRTQAVGTPAIDSSVGESAPGTTGSTTSSELPGGSSEHRLNSGGISRSYRVYRPQGLSGAVPLVLFLHGGFGTAAQAEAKYGWDSQADAGRFVVAYPDGIDRAWNAGGGCCGQPAAKGIDDVGFISAVVRDIRQQADIDPDRIYLTGMSNGGIMTYTMACRTDLFAAIGPVAATVLDSCRSPAPVSVIAVHGTADTQVRYQGGVGEGPAHIDGPAVPTVNGTWRSVDGCTPPQVRTVGPVTTSVADCPGDRSVELITVEGAGHQWPGSSVTREGADPPSTALNATAVIWQFFAAHHR